MGRGFCRHLQEFPAAQWQHLYRRQEFQQRQQEGREIKCLLFSPHPQKPQTIQQQQQQQKPDSQQQQQPQQHSQQQQQQRSSCPTGIGVYGQVIVTGNKNTFYSCWICLKQKLKAFRGV